jgi:hypothetical protein
MLFGSPTIGSTNGGIWSCNAGNLLIDLEPLWPLRHFIVEENEIGQPRRHIKVSRDQQFGHRASTGQDNLFFVM